MIKVKCIDPGILLSELTLNKEYKILEDDYTHYKIINDSGNKAIYYKWRFEKSMTDEQPEIKTGNIIELNDGTRGLVVETPTKNKFVYFYKKDYNQYGIIRSGSNLNHIKEKIVKIYEGITDQDPYVGLDYNIYRAYQVLIWEQKPKVTVTLQEIADKFGITKEQLIIKEYEEK